MMMMMMRATVLLWGAVIASGSSMASSSGSSTPFANEVETVELAVSLLGTLQYDGGFVNRARIVLSLPVELKRFRVAAPEFCGGVEILEAGTVTEGIEDPATSAPRTPGIFEVDGGRGRRVSAVFVTLNGPSSSSCVIPIFDESDSTTPGSCEVVIRGTNDLANTSFPMQVGWTSATVDRFVSWGRWSQPLTADGSRNISISQSSGACHSYITLQYDREACASDFVGRPSQTTLIGESSRNGQVTRLFALLTSRNTWNRCVVFHGSILFDRTDP